MTPFEIVLHEKADKLEAERTSIQEAMKAQESRLRDINGALAGIESLLRLEAGEGGAMATVTAKKAATNGSATAPTLYGALFDAMGDLKPHTVDDLLMSAKARGVEFGGKHPVRSAGFTLLGMSRGKKVQHLADGRWKRTE